MEDLSIRQTQVFVDAEAQINEINALISRRLRNVFLEKELDKKSVVAFFATTAADGKDYQVEYFNLDAIISVGYRVNSKRGTQFRIWATNVLKEHIVKGFTANESRYFLVKNHSFVDGNKRIAAAL